MLVDFLPSQVVVAVQTMLVGATFILRSSLIILYTDNYVYFALGNFSLASGRDECLANSLHAANALYNDGYNTAADGSMVPK